MKNNKILTTGLVIGVTLSGVTCKTRNVFAINDLSTKDSRIMNYNTNNSKINNNISDGRFTKKVFDRKINGSEQIQPFLQPGFQGFYNYDGAKWKIDFGYVDSWTDDKFSVYTGIFDINGKVYGSDSNGNSLLGLKKIGNDTYYFNDNQKDPYAIKGWKEINYEKYYFGDNYKAKKGFSLIDGSTYYFDEEGRLQTGLKEINGRKYYFGNDGKLVTGWKKIGNNEYFFDKYQGGAAYVGFLERDKNRGKVYFNNEGVKQNAPSIDSNVYPVKSRFDTVVFDNRMHFGGKPQTFENAGFQYFLKGVGHEGENNLPSGLTWSMGCGCVNDWSDDKNKFVVTIGFYDIDGKKYYSNQYGDSMMGLQYIEGDTYLFRDNYSDPYALRGWKEVKGKKYYFGDDFKAKKGISVIDGSTYCFNERGEMETGLKEINGRTYYFGNDGKLVTGLYSVNDKRYLFQNETGGAAFEGLYKDGSKGDMFFNERGVMQSGIFKNGDGYYLAKPNSNGNSYIYYGFYTDEKTGRRYYFEPEKFGKAKTGWYKTSSGNMYFNNDGTMVRGIAKIDHDWYLFRSNSIYDNAYQKYGFYSDMATVSKDRYYFNPQNEGKAQKGWYKTNKGMMHFDDAGVMSTGICKIDGLNYLFLDGNDGNHYQRFGWYTNKSDKKRYYFNKVEGPNGQALVGHRVIDGKEYEFNQEGVLIGSIK